MCFNFLTRENVDNKREDEEQCFHEPKAYIYNAPRVRVINKFLLKWRLILICAKGAMLSGAKNT